MPRKYEYVISTHDKYEAEIYRKIFNKIQADFKFINFSRVFSDELGNEEVRDYWVYRAYMTSDQQRYFKDVVKKIQFPPTKQLYYEGVLS